MGQDNNSNERRLQPHDLKGLLKFALETTVSEDASNSSSFAEMDPERRRFLEEALSSMSIDVVAEMQRICKTLISADASENAKMNAFEELGDYVENIDTANDFCKIGGLPVLMKCLESDIPSVREYAARTIGGMSQNNPYCQKECLEHNFLPKLIELVNDSDVNVKALKGISGIIRGYEPATANFIEIGGLECLLSCLSCGNEKICTQTLFMINAMISEHPIIRDELLKLKIIPKLMPLFEATTKDYNIMIETTCSVLNNIIETPEAREICRQETNLNVQACVENVIRLQKWDPSAEETISFCENILLKVFNSNENVADR